MSARAVAFVGALGALVGCDPAPLPPTGELVIYVDTDAPLPPAADEPVDQPALFDRLRVELFEPDATTPCDGCSREFGVDHRTVFDGHASFGFVATPGRTGYRARLRLFRTTGSDIVEPRATSTLERVIALPPIVDGEVRAVHAVLATGDLGAPQGSLDAPADARFDCAGDPGVGEVCVRGGAFWMGDLTLDPSYGGAPSERLVVVSSFWLDATEATIGGYRASSAPKQGFVLPHTLDPTCLYDDTPGVRDDLPLNCVTIEGARAYCKTKGARLVREAEWEYAASDRRSALHVWGDDEPACVDAVFARTTDPSGAATAKACLALGKGPAKVGSGARDRLDLPSGTIVDLMGNLTEWMDDAWDPIDGACWKGAWLRDPHCDKGPAPAAYAVRGGSFLQPGSQVRAAIRASVDSTGDPFSMGIGFRCARDASAN